MSDLKLKHGGVRVTILDGDYVQGGKPTPLAVEHYKAIIADLDNLRRFAAEKLLKLYNGTWLDDKIGAVDEKGFMKKLTNPAVHLYNEIGVALVYFDDSGLFAGHAIQVSLEQGVPVDAHIVG